MAQVLQFPIQRRRYPRVRIQQPVALVHENSTVVTGLATNVSGGGVRVLCDRYAADSLVTHHGRPGGAGPRIDAHFMLPLATGLAKLDVQCRLAYMVDLEDGQVLMGLEFLRFHHDGRAYLCAFLNEAERYA